VLVHGCRRLRTRLWRQLVATLRDDELFGRYCRKLSLPDGDAQPFRNRGRITDLIGSDQLFTISTSRR